MVNISAKNIPFYGFFSNPRNIVSAKKYGVSYSSTSEQKDQFVSVSRLQVDFDESGNQQRFCVKPSVDPELDES